MAQSTAALGHKIALRELSENERVIVTCSTMSEHIDLDVSGLLQTEYTLAEAGDRLDAVIDRRGNR